MCRNKITKAVDEAKCMNPTLSPSLQLFMWQKKGERSFVNPVVQKCEIELLKNLLLVSCPRTTSKSLTAPFQRNTISSETQSTSRQPLIFHWGLRKCNETEHNEAAWAILKVPDCSQQSLSLSWLLLVSLHSTADIYASSNNKRFWTKNKHILVWIIFAHARSSSVWIICRGAVLF